MNDRFYKKLNFFANLSLSLALAVLTFVILDFFNPKLGFLGTTYAKLILAAGGVTAAICSFFVISLICRRSHRLEAKRNHARRESREAESGQNY